VGTDYKSALSGTIISLEYHVQLPISSLERAIARSRQTLMGEDKIFQRKIESCYLWICSYCGKPPL